MQRMLLSMTILVLAISATPLPDPPIPHPPDQTSNDYKEFVPKINLEQVLMRHARAVHFEPSFKTSSEIAVPRVKRAPNAAFTELHDRTSKLARVVTAVTLYNGLVENTVPRDTAIAELMNVKPSSLADLEGFDQAKVNGFVNQLKAVPKLTDTSKDLETYLAVIHTIRAKYSEIKGRTQFPDAAAFGGVKDLETLDLSAFAGITLSGMESSLKSSDPATISTLKTSLENIAKSAQSAMTTIDDKKILDMISSLDSFHDFANLMKMYDDSECAKIRSTKKEEPPAMKTIVDNLAKLQQGSIVSSMSSMINSRTGTMSIDRKVASGFTDGFLDLIRLDSDVKDSWVQSSIGPHVSVDKVTDLSGLQAVMVTLDAQWKSASDSKIQGSLQTAASMESKFGTFPSASSSLDTIVGHLKTLPSFGANTVTRDMLAMSAAIWNLKKKVLALSEISKISQQHSSDIAALDAAIPTTLGPIQTLVSKIGTHIETIENDPKLADVVKEVTKDATPVTDFSIFAVEYKNVFEYFDGADAKFDEVAASARLIIELRKSNSDPEFYNNINKAAKSIEQSKPLLVAVQTAFNKLKATPSAEMRELKRLEALQPYSKPLGDSATVLYLVENALGKKNELMDFVSDGHFVEEGVQLLPREKIGRKEIIALWQGFSLVSQRTLALISQLESLYNAIKTPTDDSLVEYGPILETFGGLPDVQLDVDRRLLAVDQLDSILDDSTANKAVKQKLQALKQTLQSLQSLDLSFAKHSSSLSGMSTTMAEISKVFASTAPAAPIKKTNPMKKGSTMQYFDEARKYSFPSDRKASTGGSQYYAISSPNYKTLWNEFQRKATPCNRISYTSKYFDMLLYAAILSSFFCAILLILWADFFFAESETDPKKEDDVPKTKGRIQKRRKKKSINFYT